MSNDTEDFKPFTFLGNDGKPYRLMKTEGQYWVYWLHPNNNWVTFHQIEESKIHIVNNNLSEKEQACYPQQETAMDMHKDTGIILLLTCSVVIGIAVGIGFLIGWTFF